MPGDAIAYVREEDAPRLPAPRSTTGLRGWLRANLFSTPMNSILSLIFALFVVWVLVRVLNFVLFSAVFTGADREACVGENVGACWPMIQAKLPQWIYGFYPFDQRWRVNLCFLAFAAGVFPMLMPQAPFKRANAIYLFLLFPLLALVLLTGGNLNFTTGTYLGCLALLALLAALVPIVAFGMEEGIARNKAGLALALACVVVWLSSFATGPIVLHLASQDISVHAALLPAMCGVVALLSVMASLDDRLARGRPVVIGWLVLVGCILLAMAILDVDFGLVPVETNQWGGLLVTLVVAITGIVASLPIGILLALGRRSTMPVVQTLSVAFIELIRGVPLITVLFMSSVMLPLFLPPGVSFDKLLRALIGVALFSSAYMAEVVRGGLQAIPKGQYEGAMALGLSYWQMMLKIILPQALKISIPNIVGNFIALFKDTTLVLIIGLYDLLGIVQTGLRDPQWSTASSAPTGYLTVALIYWAFCFSMSRYSIYTERRLQTGHKR
jgi:general L-amino acid transport system permease protein